MPKSCMRGEPLGVRKDNFNGSAWFPNSTLYFGCHDQDKEDSFGGNKEAPVLRTCQPQYKEIIKFHSVVKYIRSIIRRRKGVCLSDKDHLQLPKLRDRSRDVCCHSVKAAYMWSFSGQSLNPLCRTFSIELSKCRYLQWCSYILCRRHTDVGWLRRYYCRSGKQGQ